jgi:uncharacterized protein
MIDIRPRSSSEAELAALDQVCNGLGGFDADLDFERVDGLLCALAAGPRELPLAECLPALLGEPFERAFADPAAQAQALAALGARLAVLRHQLDPQALFEEPDFLRLEPLVSAWTAEIRQSLVDAGEASAEEAEQLLTGQVWAAGFLDGVRALPQLWTLPAHDEAAEVFQQSFGQIEALLLDPASEDYRQHVARSYPKAEPSRDDLLAEACMSVQDLRMYWVDFAPKPATRRVEATPGRNDACPCGSGKKFKKCHGAG